MALDLHDITFTGPAMPGPFVRYKLEELLIKKKLLARESKAAAKNTEERWRVYQRKLRALGEGKEMRVTHHVLEPLIERLGYSRLESSEKVPTREGNEDGGSLLQAEDGTTLRAWAVSVGTDLDAPNKRGRAYRFSPSLIAQRVLLAKGERIGLLTDGQELRIVLSDPSGRDSNLSIDLGRGEGWRGVREVPDSYRLLRALCQPRGVVAVGDLLDDARLAQTGVTKKLREQARRAVERFIQGLLDAPENRQTRDAWGDLDEVAKQLWHEGLVLVYRLLFILKLETAADPARSFSFATVSMWRNSYSPSTALADVVSDVRDRGVETGGFLASTLRALFRLFSEGLSSTELQVNPLGGVLFGKEATPLLDSLTWSERAVADLLNALLWTLPDTKRRKNDAGLGRERVHYGALDVEDLGRVYEALLELEPGVTREPMCRLRRAKLEVVVPLEQGARYRASTAGDDDTDDEPEAGEDDGKKTKVVFVEEIPAHRFYLRVGLGRKASGSYYTPHVFVRFLVEEALGPQLAEKSPATDPSPAAVLSLKVLDPAMGSGHFLVEACRYLGEALYEACRLCDERAVEAEKNAEATKSAEAREVLQQTALAWWRRVEELPDPNDELLAYLPSRAAEGEDSGVSQSKALALCRRLIAVHCLYGVDKNPLAVELARVSLWLESYAEGLPLTFLDHRLVRGDSLMGPFFEHLLTFPATGRPIEELHSRGIVKRLEGVLSSALAHIEELEVSVGTDIADLELKRQAKGQLDRSLAPLRLLAAVWTGGVMLKDRSDEHGYSELVHAVARGDAPESLIAARPGLANMLRLGGEVIPFDLLFADVFWVHGASQRQGGFDAVVGNPPWDRINVAEKEFWSAFDIGVLDAPTLEERLRLQEEARTPERLSQWGELEATYDRELALRSRLFSRQSSNQAGETTRGSPDMWRLFAERFPSLRRPLGGRLAFIVPSSFHANEGALALRSLYFDEIGIEALYSFENRGRKFFDIHASSKFDLVIAGGGECRFTAMFYLHDGDWLFTNDGAATALSYTAETIKETGGKHRTLVELTSSADLDVLRRVCAGNRSLGDLRALWGIDIRQEINITRGANAFINRADAVGDDDPRDWRVLRTMIDNGLLTVDDDKTFHQYTDRWARWLPRYVTSCEKLARRQDLLVAATHYRLALRKTTGGRNERTAIFALLPPGHIATDKAPAERQPQNRSNVGALKFLALANSFCCDWMVRLRVQTDMNMFMLDASPAPADLPPIAAHSALRLSCNHAGYSALWREQVGEAWREHRSKYDWPVLLDADARWEVRAVLDAVIADLCGLSRCQYQHVLASFSHASYPGAHMRCLAAFDELQALGRDEFVKRHDPYWDIPLVTTLPTPVIDLPGADAGGDLILSAGAPLPPRKRKKRA